MPEKSEEYHVEPIEVANISEMEKELNEEEEFQNQIENISHTEQFPGYQALIKKLTEIAQAKTEGFGDKLVDYKIYRQEIENLLIAHETAIATAVEKKLELGPSRHSFLEALASQIDEIAVRRDDLKRHLYDLDQYLT